MDEFRFNNEHTSAGTADVIDVLRQPRLWIPTEKDYPNHSDWLDKTEAMITTGEKRAMVAYIAKAVVGAVIYQRNPSNHQSLEIRNISVNPTARGRYVGRFLLRNAEIEAVQNDFPGIEEYVVDTKINNTEMITFLESQGYDIVDIADLYGTNTGLDVVMKKRVTQSNA